MKIAFRTIAFTISFLFCIFSVLFSQEHKVNLNKDLVFKGNHIIYKSKKIELGPNSFFIDGQLTNEETAKYKYLYNPINQPPKH